MNDIGVNIGRHRGKVGGPGNETSFSVCNTVDREIFAVKNFSPVAWQQKLNVRTFLM